MAPCRLPSDVMHHMPATRLIAAIALAFSSMPCVAGSFECPFGTQYIAPAIASARTRYEACIDLLGRKQGPFRVLRSSDGTLVIEAAYRDGFLDGVIRDYDESGALVMEILYADGVMISKRIPREAVQDALDQLNADARASGKNRTVVLLDERTLGLDYVKAPPLSSLISAVGDGIHSELRQRLASTAEFCGVFKMSLFPIDQIRARWLDESGKLLLEVLIQKDDCVDQASP